LLRETDQTAKQCHKLAHAATVEKDIDIPLDIPARADKEPPPVNSAQFDIQERSSPSLLRRVGRDILLLGAGNIGIVIAQLVFRGILITALAPPAYGRLALVLSIYNTVWIIGASGLPNGVARYIALGTPSDDPAIVSAAVRAGAWPTLVAATITAIASGIILGSSAAFVFAAIGLTCLVYALLTMGILRGRGRIGPAASIMPIGGVAEVGLLAFIWLSGIGVTELSGFGIFCLGNVISLGVGVMFVLRTAPRPDLESVATAGGESGAVPSARQLLGFSMWLGAATVGVAMLPLVVRLAAALDSYTVVAIIDVAIVLFSVPQRMGAVIVGAVVPHATRALSEGEESLTVSRREHIIVIAPFVLLALIVAITPIVEWTFDLLGRPAYAESADYLALALLAGPARVLYGLVEGVLVAHGEGRFLAFNALSIAVVASAAILATAALWSIMASFVAFVVSCWVLYLCGFRRIERLRSIRSPVPVQS
jgi:O-antigen/teichoic acid export membrane protein